MEVFSESVLLLLSSVFLSALYPMKDLRGGSSSSSDFLDEVRES